VKGSPYWYRTDGERDNALVCTLEWIPSLELERIDAKGNPVYHEFEPVK